MSDTITTGVESSDLLDSKVRQARVLLRRAYTRLREAESAGGLGDWTAPSYADTLLIADATVDKLSELIAGYENLDVTAIELLHGLRAAEFQINHNWQWPL